MSPGYFHFLEAKMHKSEHLFKKQNRTESSKDRDWKPLKPCLFDYSHAETLHFDRIILQHRINYSHL